MKTISVIVPNYNSGKYIARCLDSLLEQEYQIKEIIVIDDKSTDESIEIAKKYAQKYDAVKLEINNENRGVSYSRNRGIQISESEYIMFCDGDDWYEKNATKEMINIIEKENADFVCACYYITYNENKKIEITYSNIYDDGEISKKECIASLPITSSAKLIKKSLITDNQLEYPENIKNCEELPIIPLAAYYAKKVVYMNKCIYNYFQRTNSASNKLIKDLAFFEITYEKFKEKLPNKYNIEIKQRMVEHLLYSKTMLMIRNKNVKKDIVKNIHYCKEEMKRNKYQ